MEVLLEDSMGVLLEDLMEALLADSMGVNFQEGIDSSNH